MSKRWFGFIILNALVVSIAVSLPAFAIQSTSAGTYALSSAKKECKSDKPCDRPTLQECKNDLLKNVCPKPERTCPTLYFDWNGKEYSVTCPVRGPKSNEMLLLDFRLDLE